MHRIRRCGAVLPLLALPVMAAAQWELVWSDEFNGPAIDTSKWTHEVNGWGGGNNELQYYTARPQNSFIQDGSLRIRAIKETFTGPDGTRGYTSARMVSAGKGDWRYGRIEARARLPLGQGLWPAIWMLPTDWVYGGWAASGEIDIMEYRGNEPNRIHGTLHYGGEWPNNTYSGDFTDGPDYSADFHVFAVEWDEMEIRWFVDGIFYQSQTSWFSTAGDYPAPFDQRFHLILNVAVGGNFLPDPPPDANYFPQEMAVDWVRVYKRVEAPYLGSAITLPARIEAEHFNWGGNDIGYRDLTSSQLGSGFRENESADIQPTTDAGGGFNVGYVQPGEWMQYFVETDSASMWTIDFRVASNNNGGIIRVGAFDSFDAEVDRVSVAVPHTNGWQNWTTVSTAPLQIPQGVSKLRVEVVSGEFNINWLEPQQVPDSSTEIWMIF